MTDAATDDRYGELRRRYDQLGLALLRQTDLEDFVLVLKAHDVLLAGLHPDDPGVAETLGRSNTYHALAAVAEEVLRLKREATS